jgi:hypothetical protein
MVIMNTELSLLLAVLLGLRRRVMDSSVFCFCCLWFHGCEMQSFVHITSWLKKMGNGIFCALLLLGGSVVKSSLLLTSHGSKATLPK